MRLVRSGVGISTVLLLASSFSLASGTNLNTTVGGETDPGLFSTKYIAVKLNGESYLQAGSFKSKHNAKRYRSALTKKYKHPVIIKKQGNYYVVFIRHEVRGLNNAVVEVSQNPHEKHHLIPASSESVIVPIIEEAPSPLRVMGALGVANLSGGDSSWVITTNETDTLRQTNGNNLNALAAQLGLGYVYYLHGAQQYSEYTQWFPSVEPQLNGYYLGEGSIKGDVWRFSNPNFNDMTYSLFTESYRLMVDTAVTLLSRRQYSLYAIGGIGNAWNRIDYRDRNSDGFSCPQSLNLNSARRSNFAWEVGAGLSYAFNNRVSLTLEYLYADLGGIKTPFTGVTTPPPLGSANFKLIPQTALLGLHLAV